MIERYEGDDDDLLPDVSLPQDTIPKLTAALDAMISQLGSVPEPLWEVFKHYWGSEWRDSYQDHLQPPGSRNNNETDEF